jgi:ATP-dependent DNA helicase RecG
MTRRREEEGAKRAPELSARVGTVKGIGPRRAEALAETGILTVEDLLLTLPFRYEDRSRFAAVSELHPGMRAAVRGIIASPVLLRTRIRGFTIFHLQLRDESGILPCVWYNQPYLRHILKEGRRAVLFGEAVLPDRGKRVLQFMNPQHEILGDDPDGVHTGRIVPIYRRVGDLSSRGMRGIVRDLLDALPGDLPDSLPAGTARDRQFPSRGEAIRQVHFPEPGADPVLLEQGRTPAHLRLSFEELFKQQSDLARSREERRRRDGIPLQTTPEDRARHAARLPFPLTMAQEKALGEILDDLRGPSPMCRLLQGDVGSGKTVVAFLAAMAALENGCQAAVMVPTETLAEQHHRTLGRLLSGTGFRISILTSGLSSPERRRILQAAREGSVDLLVGTHALIQEEVSFRKLGLVVVDEQHRFGVRQRERLQGKGIAPHLLLMTATPIPRSLALACYGDMEMSVIDEIPDGRGSVRTVLRTAAHRERIYRFIRRESEEGRRVVIVHPVVQHTEGRDLKSAVRQAELLARGPFAGIPVGLLHGRMPSEEKRRTMDDFGSGAIRILVTTTVVEVGMDVPEASVMVVENAERFGLSQLHQLRGRVGRGPAASWCILIPGEGMTEEAQVRLGTLCSIADGFEIARRDLEMRGPGELLGIRQSGEQALRVARLPRDSDLLEMARRAVTADGIASTGAALKDRSSRHRNPEPRRDPVA